MTPHVEDILSEILKKNTNFALQVDESTDIIKLSCWRSYDLKKVKPWKTFLL
jgi:hypothetical protein